MTKRRKKAASIDDWLVRAATPVFIVDSERHVAAFNAGCETLTGWAAAEVIGETCHYGSGAERSGPAAFAASLSPPPDAFAGVELAAPAYVIHKDGRALPQLLQFFPLRDDKARVQGILGIILPLRQPGPALEISPARCLHAELAAMRVALRLRFGPNTLVAEGVAMRKVLAQIELAHATTTPVLLEGEPGTGKEHLARVIHLSGANRGRWFVPLDCRRLGPDELARVWDRLIATHHPSAANEAGPEPGTVFLADVDGLARDLQERLVKVFLPDDPRKALPLRLLTATTRDLKAAVAEQSVRADFFAMISPLTIGIPPLRERGSDLPLLAQHFLEDLNDDASKQAGGFEEAVWPLLRRYQWPANLDELSAVIREARSHCGESLIRVQDLPFRFRTALEAQELPPPAEQTLPSLDLVLTKVEMRLVALALARSKGNKTKAADLLGVQRARLIRRVEQLGLGDGPPAGVPGGPMDELAAELMQDEPRPE